MATDINTSSQEIEASVERFEFGRNWARFLRRVDAARIAAAEQSLKSLLGVDSLAGKRFLDAGSGSGLFSLAAHRLNAEVTSFDVDPQCVACTRELKQRFGEASANWGVKQGSLVDRDFLGSLGKFDVVYCWGVSHHTGAMWQAIENLTPLVEPSGKLVLAIYNDQQYISRAWRSVKRFYQWLPKVLQPLLVAGVGLAMFCKRAVVTLAACLLRLMTLRNPWTPIGNWLAEGQQRGMHGWHDLVDWVGGWPFEVARPEEVFRFLRDRGFVLQDLTTLAGHGCNEFLFVKQAQTPAISE